MSDQLERRVSALERAVTDGETGCAELADAAATAEQVADLTEQVTDLDDRVAELEAATQALRGYVGNVREVNETVENRADRALSAVERLERQVGTDRAAGDIGRQGRHAGQTEGGAPGVETNGAEADGRGPNHDDGAQSQPRPQGHAGGSCEACGRPIGAEATSDLSAERAVHGPGVGTGTEATGTAGSRQPRTGGDDDSANGPLARLRGLL